MTIRYVLWDNDGVLVDTEVGYFEVTREVFAELGISLERDHYMRLRSRGESAWQLVAQTGVGAATIARHRADRDQRYRRFIRAHDVEIAGAADIVATLARSYRMAIVTTSKRRAFELIHRQRRIVRHMAFVLTQEDVVNEKPAPDGYLAALERFGANAAETVVVEDSKQGLDAARAAGLTCVIVRNRFFGDAHDFTGAAAVLGSIDEVPNAITGLIG